jgi:hypothetical protein
VPGISASSSDVLHWNMRSSSYFEVLFAFAKANLHDDGVIVFSRAADPNVSREIHNWAHTDEFYVAEDWFGMNDLDLQSPTSPSDLVISLLPRLIFPYLFSLNFSNPNSNVWNFVRLASSSSKCSFIINLF